MIDTEPVPSVTPPLHDPHPPVTEASVRSIVRQRQLSNPGAEAMRTVHRQITRCLTALAAAVALGLTTRDASAQVTVGGVGYVQYGFALAKDTLTADSSIQHINNFDITRAYINVGARLPGGIVTRVTADIFQNAAINGSRLF